MENENSQQTTAEKVCAYMERVGGTLRDLSRQAKLSPVTLRAALANDAAPSLRTRCAIEAALGQPFWSTEADFERRKAEAKTIGFAPEVVGLNHLKRRASQLGIKGYGALTNKAALTALMLEQLAAREARRQEIQARMEADFASEP